MKVRAFTAGLAISVMFIAGILIASAAGYWKTESSRVPTKLTKGAFEGTSFPSDIRGSYTLRDLEKAFNIPFDILAESFGITEENNPESFQISELKDIYGIVNGYEIGTSSIKLFVALFNGLIYEPEEDTAIPEPAWTVLYNMETVNSEILSSQIHRVVPLENSNSQIKTTNSEVEKIIKGKTRFIEVLDWGLSENQINRVLGTEIGNTEMSIRDFCTDYNIQFSAAKISLQELLDKLD